MTVTHSTKGGRLLSVLSVTAVLTLIGAVLVLSDEAAEAARRGLILCGQTLIPALFPFLVLSNLLMRLGFPLWLGARIGGPIGKLFGIRPACVAAVVVGLFSGFPAGAASAFQLREQGVCDDRDMARTVSLSSLASPGFLISGIGGGMLGSRRLGLHLCVIQWMAVLTTGALEACLFGRRSNGEVFRSAGPKRSLLTHLSGALREGADAMIGICGAVLFFSVLSGFLSLFSFPNLIRCLLTCFLEITSGASLSAELLPPTIAFVVIAMATGWNGLSVHAQTLMVTGGRLPVLRHLIIKGVTALAAGLLALLFVTLGLL